MKQFHNDVFLLSWQSADTQLIKSDDHHLTRVAAWHSLDFSLEQPIFFFNGKYLKQPVFCTVNSPLTAPPSLAVNHFLISLHVYSLLVLTSQLARCRQRHQSVSHEAVWELPVWLCHGLIGIWSSARPLPSPLRAAPLHTAGAPAGQSGCSTGPGGHTPTSHTLLMER